MGNREARVDILMSFESLVFNESGLQMESWSWI
jgi:hypothetical protein